MDFEKGLSVAVTKLRAALNDSAESPAYVETVAGQGYRFIGDVERVATDNSASAPALTETEPPRPAMSQSPNGPEIQPHSVGPYPNSSSARNSWWHAQPTLWLASAVCIVLLALAIIMLSRRAVGASDQTHRGKIMLVVLPFENLSGDSSQEYLSDGITEELSEQLGNLNPERLGVIGRTSAMAYKHSSRTISQIGKDLGVSYVLEGSVRREDRRLRVTAQLVEVSNQTHVWAAKYDRDIGDMLQLEDDLGREITQQVGVSVALDSPKKLNRHSPDPEAHQDYLLARYYWNKRTPVGSRTAEKYFRQAIDKDPQYAAPYAGLAESEIPVPDARAAALKAVELDPSSGEAHTALGFIALFRDLDLPAAERELKTAIRLDPNYATAHHWYSGVLGATGRPSEGLAEITEAAKLDPLSLIIRSALAGSLSIAGKQDAAMAQIKIVFDMDPHFAKGHEILGGIYSNKGMYKEAIREFQLAEHYGRYRLPGDLGYAYARLGDKKEALRIVAELEAFEKTSGAADADIYLARVEMAFGDRDKAMVWLQRGDEHHNSDGLLDLNTDPIFSPLHSDPRFQDMVRHLNLVPSAR